jgi:zinc protease
MSKAILFFCCLSVLVVLAVGFTAQAGRIIDELDFPRLNEIKMPKVEKVALDNGITLYLLEDRELPMVRANVRLAPGGYLDPADKIGLGSITGTVMRTGGTEQMSGDEIDEALESIGASIEVSIDNTGGSASMRILSEYVDTGLVILADILRSPQFDEDKIELAKTAERTAISSRNDEALDVCIREFKKVIYGADSPYARHTEYKTINGITREDLIEFHKKYISPENVMIAVWGDFKKKEMINKIKGYFGDWQPGPGTVPKLPEVDYEFKSAVHYIHKENINQSTILIGHIGGLTGDPDYFALTVANDVLGGSLGGRMFNEVRSRQGLAYSTGAMFTTRIAYPGFYYNYVITKLETTVEAAKAVIHEIRRMQTDPPTSDELHRAKESYLNSFVFKFDSKGEILNRMMTYDYYDFPQDFLYKVKENIEKVTAEDVVDVAQRRFKPDQMHIVVVGKADEFDEPLSALGPLDTIDITIPTAEEEEDIIVNEQTLARGMELLRKAVDACGGVDNFRKIKTVSSSRKIALVTPQGELGLEANSMEALPDREKVIMTTPMGEIVSVTVGDSGWMLQAGNVVDLTPEQILENSEERFRSTILLFQSVADPQFQSNFLVTEDFNGVLADILMISSPDGKFSFKMALDAESHLPLGKMYFGETIMGPGSLTEILSDYREIAGVNVPFRKTVKSNGNDVVKVEITSYEVNAELPEGAFDRP